MFKKTNRLNRAEFEVFFKNGRRYHTKHLQLIYTTQPTLKVAVVVPKKVVKSAVERNRLRRQLYHQSKQILINATGVYIFLVKNSILDINNSDRLAEIKKLVGVINKPS